MAILKKNEVLERNFFFAYHSGGGKYLTLWIGMAPVVSEIVTSKVFNNLPSGIRFSLNNSESIYETTASGINQIR